MAEISGVEVNFTPEITIIEQIACGILVPFLLLYHKSPIFYDFQWHWFNLAGYEEFEGEFCVQAAIYGDFR